MDRDQLKIMEKIVSAVKKDWRKCRIHSEQKLKTNFSRKGRLRRRSCAIRNQHHRSTN